MKGRTMGVKVRQHTRTLGGRKRRGRGFTILFRMDITPVRHGDNPPDRMGGAVYDVFALRLLAKDEAAALAQVSRDFNYPEILAAFRGWPQMFRGTPIRSRADLEALHGRAASDARERANMEAALNDPARNLYLAAHAIAAAGVGGLRTISKAAAQVKKGKAKR
jgi:hypothetical protein